MKKTEKMGQAILKCAVRSILRFDRYVIKAYTGIETPLYKLWWRERATQTQRMLDDEHLYNGTF